MSKITEQTNMPHPNWAALSACHWNFKKFVKAKEQDCFTDHAVGPRSNPVLDGEEIKAFYEDTVDNDEFARPKITSENTKCETIEIISDNEEEVSDIEIYDPDIDKKLLTAIQNGDFETLKRLGDCDYNCVDQYGWTALEIACVSGHDHIVRYILEKGGLIKNERIYKILREKGLSEILDILKHKVDETEILVIDIDPSKLEHCDECGEMFDTDMKASHISTITHQLSLKHEHVKKNPGFGIPESNIGFKLMKKSGWDGVSGLGDDHTGKLFPVKTILKQDRKGLETGDSRRSRVTHFGPLDEKSVANRKYAKKDHTKRKLKNIIKRGNKLNEVTIQPEQILRENLGEI